MSVQNVEYLIDENKLVLEVDLSKSLGPSKSKKRENIAIVFPPEQLQHEKWQGLSFTMVVNANPPKAKAAPRQRMNK